MDDEVKLMTLDEIEQAMKDLIISKDFEGRHVDGDNLLGDLIQALVIGTEKEEQARRIWNAYCKISKVYA